MDNIETQIWYLKDAETHGLVNQTRAEFFGAKKKDLENKSLYDLTATREEAETCIAGNLEVFRQKQKIHSEELVLNGNGEERFFPLPRCQYLIAITMWNTWSALPRI